MISRNEWQAMNSRERTWSVFFSRSSEACSYPVFRASPQLTELLEQMSSALFTFVVVYLAFNMSNSIHFYIYYVCTWTLTIYQNVQTVSVSVCIFSSKWTLSVLRMTECLASPLVSDHVSYWAPRPIYRSICRSTRRLNIDDISTDIPFGRYSWRSPILNSPILHQVYW